MTFEKGFEDLNEFFDRWPAERARIVSLATSRDLTVEDRDLLKAMIFVVDRVGPNEVEAG